MCRGSQGAFDACLFAGAGAGVDTNRQGVGAARSIAGAGLQGCQGGNRLKGLLRKGCYLLREVTAGLEWLKGLLRKSLGVLGVLRGNREVTGGNSKLLPLKRMRGKGCSER